MAATSPVCSSWIMCESWHVWRRGRDRMRGARGGLRVRGGTGWGDGGGGGGAREGR